MGAYSSRIEKLRGNKPASQIRADKCHRSKLRGIERKKEKEEEIQNRLDHWRSLSFEQQLKELDKRPGKSKKQREKIASLITV